MKYKVRRTSYLLNQFSCSFLLLKAKRSNIQISTVVSLYLGAVWDEGPGRDGGDGAKRVPGQPGVRDLCPV